MADHDSKRRLRKRPSEDNDSDRGPAYRQEAGRGESPTDREFNEDRDNNQSYKDSLGGRDEFGGRIRSDYNVGQNDEKLDELTDREYTPLWRMPGPFTGSGPRRPQRSDEQIKDETCQRLTRHGQVDARDIEVRVEGGEITLQGEIDSLRAKRLAEAAVEGIRGVQDIHNRLRVRRSR